jgi:cellulose synthase/poly-beta-1,6-N-acetylglucosamine synthase-like glycosyltransferase
VRYEGRAVARTFGPETWYEFYRQRLRWSRGTLQVLQLHSDMVFSPRQGLFGTFWLPYLLVSGFGTLILDLMVLVLGPLLALQFGEPVRVLGLALLSILVIEAVAALGYAAGLVATGRCPPQVFLVAWVSKPFTTFLSAVRAVALYRELRAKEVTW